MATAAACPTLAGAPIREVAASGTATPPITSIRAAMSATIIDGKAIAAGVRAQVAEEVRAFVELTGRTPGLATVLVGDDPGSAVYVGGKQRACAEVGMTPFDKRLAADASFAQVADCSRISTGTTPSTGCCCSCHCRPTSTARRSPV